LLESNQELLSTEEAKFANLLSSLKKQVVPSGNSLNRTLKISGLKNPSTRSIHGLFANASRIGGIRRDGETRAVYLDFPSHSAARKTLEGFTQWEEYTVEWVSVTGEVMGDANFTKPRTPFNFKLFTADPTTNFLCTVQEPEHESWSDSEVGE
jgi:hypothetical protein